MAEPHSVLVTGTTGMAGREIVRRLLQTSEIELTLFLHQQGRRLSRADLLREIFRLEPNDCLIRRLRVVEGDLRAPQLGLAEELRTRLAGRVDAILHAAASTRFDLPLGEARHHNVLTTRNLIGFARRCPRLSRFGFLSTVFVSGRRCGLVRESERQHEAGFVNTYEQAKYESEGALESSGLPYAIYRLSTLLGDGATGFTTHFTTPHQSVRIMHLGLASMVPGQPDCPVDLVPTDWAAATIADLFLRRFQPGQALHLVAGPDRSFTLTEVIDETYRCLGELDPTWKAHRYPKPAITTQQAFSLLVRSAEQAQDALMMGVLGALKHFTEQFSYPKVFESNLAEISPAPDIRDYYSRVVEYCLRTRWGRGA